MDTSAAVTNVNEHFKLELSDVDTAQLPKLHQLCANGDLERAARCIKEGTNVNSTISMSTKLKCTMYGVTPLFLAAQRGHNDLCRLLMQRGADPNIASYMEGRPEDTCTPAQVARLNLHFLLAYFLDTATTASMSQDHGQDPSQAGQAPESPGFSLRCSRAIPPPASPFKPSQQPLSAMEGTMGTPWSADQDQRACGQAHAAVLNRPQDFNSGSHGPAGSEEPAEAPDFTQPYARLCAFPRDTAETPQVSQAITAGMPEEPGFEGDSPKRGAAAQQLQGSDIMIMTRNAATRRVDWKEVQRPQVAEAETPWASDMSSGPAAGRAGYVDVLAAAVEDDAFPVSPGHGLQMIEEQSEGDDNAGNAPAAAPAADAKGRTPGWLPFRAKQTNQEKGKKKEGKAGKQVAPASHLPVPAGLPAGFPIPAGANVQYFSVAVPAQGVAAGPATQGLPAAVQQSIQIIQALHAAHGTAVPCQLAGLAAAIEGAPADKGIH